MRFFLDEDLSDKVAQIARNLGLDACSVHEANRRELDDFEQLDYAAEHEMIMVTRNRDDFQALTREYHASGKPHYGVLIVPRGLSNNRPDRIAHALKRWADKKEEAPESFGPYMWDFLQVLGGSRSD
jgi:predicted nuclease of predicted toxin-antitoxin system